LFFPLEYPHQKKYPGVNMSQQTIFFDVGGTLLDAPDIFSYITGKLTDKSIDLKTYNLLSGTFFAMLPRDEANQSFKTIEEILTITLNSLSEKYGYKNISDQANDMYLDVYLHQSAVFPEVPALLQSLQKNKVKMILASDADGENMEQQLIKFDLNKYFVEKCISSFVRAYKPTSGFIRHLRKHISDDRTDCYFVGDSFVDIESGKSLGIKSVLIDRKNGGKSFGADYVINNLNELLPILGLEK
jgi:HAD superfamily hydrolase (TIGR01549 family)